MATRVSSAGSSDVSGGNDAIRLSIFSTATDTDIKVTPQHRKNTKEEKRRMRNACKKRLRRERKHHTKSVKGLKCKLEAAQEKAQDNERKITALKRMTRTFWERWKL